MRMTNEQFQAEVLRRSKAYMQQRQVRRRQLRTGALVFAGCLVVVLAGVMPRMRHHNMLDMQMTTAEQPTNGSFWMNGEDGAEEAACENDEASLAMDAADEEFDGAANESAPVMQDAHNSGVAGTEKKPAAAVAVGSNSEESESYAEEADAEPADSSDLLAMLGIEEMPEQLGGCALDSESADGVYLYSDGDGWNEDRWMAVRLSLHNASDNSAGITEGNTPDGERAAEFYLRGVRVQIYAVGCTYSQFKTAAEELQTYLKQEGSQ